MSFLTQNYELPVFYLNFMVVFFPELKGRYPLKERKTIQLNHVPLEISAG